MTNPTHNKVSNGGPAPRSGSAAKFDSCEDYLPSMAKPALHASEEDSESAWADFQSLQAEDEVRWSKTVPGSLLETIRNPKPGAPGDSIVWTDDLLTGFKGMDEDHKVWIVLANEVLAASQPGLAQAGLRNALDKLALYSNDHFLRENTAMKDSDYRFTNVHMAAHATMMKTIIEFRRRLYSNVYLDLKELQDFILIWLPRHIIQIDKGLAQVLSHQR